MPTVAAIADGMDEKGDGERNVLICCMKSDTHLAIEDGNCEVKGTASDTHSCGEEFDNGSVDFCLLYLKRNLARNHRVIHCLRLQREGVKRTLCFLTHTTIEIVSLFSDTDHCFTLRKENMEKTVQDVSHWLTEKQLTEHGEFLAERTELADMLTLITKTEDRGEEGEEGVEEEENEKAEEEEGGRQEDGEEETEDGEPTDRLQEANYLDVVEVATDWVTGKRKTKQRRSQGGHEEESAA